MNEKTLGEAEVGFDRLLAFAIPERDCRGRVTRLGPTLDRILAAHDYPPAIKMLLAEALVLTALMGGLLKDEGDQMTMQAQAKGGIISLLVCDYRDGEVRGYVQHDGERFAEMGANPPLEALFGEGYLAITFDIADSGQRYQGVVPLEGDTLSEAVEAYFDRSEQIPTLIRTAVRSAPEGCTAGGLLVQHLADGEEGRERLHVRPDRPEWEHVAAMASSVRHEELVDGVIGLEMVVWRLYHEENEVTIEPTTSITRGCRCSEVHFEEVLARFPSEERKDMRDERGLILVDCEFCSRVFEIQD